jgi:hypothetical protein
VSERLAILEVQIPILAAKLQAMNRERKALKAAQTMRTLRKDERFNAKVRAAVVAHHQTPEAKRQWESVLSAHKPRLPWPRESDEYKRYRCLKLKGWTRELAIEKVQAEMRA